MDRSPHLARAFSDEPDQTYQTSRSPGRFCRRLAWLDAQEVSYVRMVVSTGQRHPKLLTINAFVNSMGNGWLYLPLVILVFLLQGWRAWRFMLVASLSVIIAHSLYSWIKTFVARLRPCDFDSTLGSTIKALDRYSCPSGHCMTATAVGIPLVLAFPAALLPTVTIWLMIAWSRVSLGHHYPTDLLLGGIIGSVIALPISMLIL